MVLQGSDGLCCLPIPQPLFGPASGDCIVLPVVPYQKGGIPSGLCVNIPMTPLEGEFCVVRCSCASPEERRLAW